MQILRHIALILSLAPILFVSPELSAQSDKNKGMTIVIDAGHGGHDGGAPSADRKLWEKNINLDVALKLKKKINASCPDVKVILTRDKDFFVKLAERGAIANRAGADLFISIHVNQAAATSAQGFEIWCLGPDNGRNISEIVDFENQSLELESDKSDYGGFDPKDPTTFMIASLQSDACLSESLQLAADMIASMKKGPISSSRGVKQSQKLVVLWKTAMPSILVEIGFISNESDRKTLASEDGRDKIAEALFKGFLTYKKRVDVSSPAPAVSEPEKSASSEVAVESKEATVYGVQIFAGSNLLSKTDKAFMGYEPLIVKSTTLYKYIIGVSPSVSETEKELEKIRKKYPQSFLVKVEGNSVSRVK